jgi:hypothetical protein
MPDDRSIFDPRRDADLLKEIVPPVLMTLGAISLLRISRFLSLAVLGAYLYHAAENSDDLRKTRGRDLGARRLANHQIDTAIDDSFPASDPPSYSGSTAGAP